MMQRNVVTRPIIGALIALIASGGALLATRSPAPPPPPLEPGDTVVVYGPQTFSTTSGSLQHHLERFELTSVPGQKFLLKVENGLPDGSKRVGGGAVVLNGSTILSSGELAAGGPGWTNLIQELTEDTLQVSVSGDAGDEVTVSVLATVSGTFNIFGVERFTRLNGTPATDERTFTLPSSAGAPYSLCLVNGNADGSNRIASAEIKLNGTQIIGSSDLSKQVGGIIRSVTPTSGTNTLSVKLTAQPSGFVDLCVMATDVGDPVLTISAPAPGFVTRDSVVEVTGTVTDVTATQVEVNGLAATLGSGNSWSVDVPLVEGENTLAVTATDAAGNTTDSTRVVHRDLTPPEVTITTPPVDGLTADSVITLAGTAFDDNAFTLNVNGLAVSVDSLGNWSTQVAVPNVVNLYVVSATDAAGNVGSAVRVIGRDNEAPTLTVTTPEQNDTTETSAVTVTGTVVDSSAVLVTVNGDTVAVTGGAFEHMVELMVGPNTVLVIATDAFGNVSTVSRTVVRTAPGPTLPPDPSTVAPKLDSTVATNVYAATAFLWTDANPIQTGVVTGAISPTQVVVFRGKVLDNTAAVLTDATVSVSKHPELGQTRTRADGRFDIGANGGGAVTLEFTKTGYLPVQRTYFAPWQQWITVDSIVMIPLDTNVTTIDFADSVQVARGSVVTDTSGTRQVTLMFKQGTTAQLVLPNGSLQGVSTLNVRATEYTAGDLGPAAMPGLLPSSSGYTYAAELSTDEATAAGAREVLFSQPVSFYLDNFLNIPVGTEVPIGYYDRDVAAWKPELDGRVISIVSVTSGLANIAVTSAGTAASQAVLDSLGFTTAERRELANLYPVGKTLWRSTHTHFSPIDWNFRYLLAAFSNAAKVAFDQFGSLFDCNSCSKPGSVIGVQNQTLGEAIGIAGTPFALNYSSDRSTGARFSRRITIPEQVRVDTATLRVTGVQQRNQMPSHALAAEYVLKVAGREIRKGPYYLSGNIPAVTLEWDGLDAAGRQVYGEQKARISVEYLYPNIYNLTGGTGALLRRSFSSGAIAGNTNGGPTRQPLAIVQIYDFMMGGFDSRALGLGGWSLSAHHAYNPTSGILYHGDGSRVEAPALGQSVRPLVNAGSNDIAVAPNGEFFLAFGGIAPNVQRYAPDGTGLGRYAGHPSGSGFSGEGVRADSSRLTAPNAIAVGPDGLLYIADGNTNRIRRVDADGKLRTYAGTGSSTSSGDGGPALSAGINNPRKLAFLPDGSLIFLEGSSNVLRKIAPNGIVSRFAGTGTFGYTGDNGPATSANLFLNAQGIALAAGPDGSVYVSQVATFLTTRRIVRRIKPDGIIETVAGINQLAGLTPARQIIFGEIADLDVSREGELLISQFVRVYGVSKSGDLRVVAGSSQRCFFGTQVTVCDPALPMTRGLATQFKFAAVGQIKLAPDGTLLVGDTHDNRTRAINPALPGFDQNDILVASSDGGAVYQFNQYGRHLRTLDALTRDTVLAFGYDAVGRVTSVTDADAQVTTVERNGSGAATAIVAPEGQRTELGYDGAGFLDEVLNPKGERVTFVTDTTGLLRRMTDPRGGQYAFAFDSLGRLLSDSSAAGQIQTLARVETDTSSVVTYGDGEGRTTVYRLDRLGGTARKRTVTDPAGLVTVSTTFANDSSVTVAPDSTQMMVVNQGGHAVRGAGAGPEAGRDAAPQRAHLGGDGEPDGDALERGGPLVAHDAPRLRPREQPRLPLALHEVDADAVDDEPDGADDHDRVRHRGSRAPDQGAGPGQRGLRL